MTRTSPERLGFLMAKLWWGVRHVGPFRVAMGLLRLLFLTVRRPAWVTTRARSSGLSITFRYPQQLIPTLVVFGDLLEPELALLRDHLEPGRTAVDVGASIGTWTMMAARRGAAVHACEPDPTSVATLESNLAANGLADRVVLHRLAIGEQSGRASLTRRVPSFLNSVDEAPAQTGELSLMTLGDFLEGSNIAEVDVLKVNTAGHEAQVMAGALPVFRAGRVRLAMMLDGVALRDAIDAAGLDNYSVDIYDGDLGRQVPARTPAGWVARSPSPMNHYLILTRRQPPL